MANPSCDSFELLHLYDNKAARLPLDYRRDLQQVADELIWTSERTGKGVAWEFNLVAFANLSEVRHGCAVGLLAAFQPKEVPGYRYAAGEPLCYLVSAVAPRRADAAWKVFSRFYHDAMLRAVTNVRYPLRSLPAQRPPRLPVVWLCYAPAASRLPAGVRTRLAMYAGAYAATLVNTCRRRFIPDRALPSAHECEIDVDETDSE